VLRRAVEERSRRYTTERERLGEPISGRADLAARALFFSVADAAKIHVPLAELAGRGVLPGRRPLKVVDVGAGAGAMSFGIAAFLSSAIEVTAYDRDGAALEIFAEASAAMTGITVTTIVSDLEALELPRDAFDLAAAGSVLNELPEDAAWTLLRELVDAIAPDGAVIVIEPALRETARRLHRLRDRAIEAGIAHVFAPCTRSCAPCTALADERDWCHEDRRVILPSRAREIARATGLREAGLKFAYLVLRRARDPLIAPVRGRRAFRVVSHMLDSKGKQECFGCGEEGRVHLRRLRRERSDANRGFERAHRGDVLLLPDGAGSDIARDTPVELLRPSR
jgi:SAM-dependent methyltransferase